MPSTPSGIYRSAQEHPLALSAGSHQLKKQTQVARSI